MKKLLQIDFPYSGPFGEQMTQALTEIAESINQEPGLIWKIWTENAEQQTGGGIYLFEDADTAKAYLAMHSARLQQMGIQDIRGQIFDINPELSRINQGPF